MNICLCCSGGHACCSCIAVIASSRFGGNDSPGMTGEATGEAEMTPVLTSTAPYRSAFHLISSELLSHYCVADASNGRLLAPTTAPRRTGRQRCMRGYRAHLRTPPCNQGRAFPVQLRSSHGSRSAKQVRALTSSPLFLPQEASFWPTTPWAMHAPASGRGMPKCRWVLERYEQSVSSKLSFSCEELQFAGMVAVLAIRFVHRHS